MIQLYLLLADYVNSHKDTKTKQSVCLLRLDKYSGREIGQKLSRSIMEHIGLLIPEVSENEAEEELPTFYMPQGVGGVLPNDLFYYYIKKIEWARPQLTVIKTAPFLL